jgi:predicted aspartyl protease
MYVWCKFVCYVDVFLKIRKASVKIDALEVLFIVLSKLSKYLPCLGMNAAH